MQGWIKLHRCLMYKPIWQESTPEQKVILTTILMMANHQGREWEWKGKVYKAEPGQFVTSLESITTKCGKGITMQNVRTALKRFEKYEFLTNESTNKNRLITIVNWGLYQANEDEPNKQDNKQLTSNQQATNKQLTTNKNVKNVKNENKTLRSKLKFETHHLQLAKLLLKEIKKNKDNFKEPNLDEWANTFRLMMERDKREGKEIQDAILFCQSHHFWYKNILSADKLRKQYDRLSLEMEDNKPKTQPKERKKSREQLEHEELVRRMQERLNQS